MFSTLLRGLGLQLSWCPPSLGFFSRPALWYLVNNYPQQRSSHNWRQTIQKRLFKSCTRGVCFHWGAVPFIIYDCFGTLPHMSAVSITRLCLHSVIVSPLFAVYRTQPIYVTLHVCDTFKILALYIAIKQLFHWDYLHLCVGRRMFCALGNVVPKKKVTLHLCKQLKPMCLLIFMSEYEQRLIKCYGCWLISAEVSFLVEPMYGIH